MQAKEDSLLIANGDVNFQGAAVTDNEELSTNSMSC
jgi:hypothetical protein